MCRDAVHLQPSLRCRGLQGKDARRATRAAAMFGRAYHQRGPRRGHRIQIGQTFDAPAVLRQPGVMRREIGRDAMIQRQRIAGDARRPGFQQHLRRFDMKAGEVHLALGIGIAELGIIHKGTPARIHRHAGAIRDRAIGGNPGLQIIGRNLRIRIFGGACTNIHDAKRHDQVLHRNLVHGRPIGREMQRRVHMRARMLIHPLFLEVEAVFREIELLFLEELLVPEECREIGVDRMGHIRHAGMG